MGQLAEAGVLQGITEPEILGDDTEAAAFFAMQTPAGDLPTAQRITVTDGLISAIRIYFDPRPLTGDGATAG
jgi:hypothetical protein